MSLHSSNQLELDLRVGPAFSSYRKKDVNRLSGVTKIRTIYVPNGHMRQLQKILLREIRSLNLSMPYAAACLPGASIMAHVEPHIGNQFVVQYDLENAYGAVQPRVLRKLLSPHGTAGRWIGEVAIRYSMHPGGGLVTGAASSPDLFNLYAAKLIDGRLAPLLEEWGDVIYTRYLDDLVFSSGSPIGKRRRSQILEVIRTSGFQLSQHKTKLSDLSIDPHVVINGVGVRLTGKLFVSRRYKRFLWDLLVGAQKGETPPQLLASYMGAFYAAAGDAKWLTGSEKRIHQMYKALLRTWRSSPERVARRTAKQQAYRAHLGPTKRSNKRKAYRRRHPQRWNGRRKRHRKRSGAPPPF